MKMQLVGSGQAVKEKDFFCKVVSSVSCSYTHHPIPVGLRFIRGDRPAEFRPSDRGQSTGGSPGTIRLINLCLFLQPQIAFLGMLWLMCLPISMAEGCVPATAGCVTVGLITRRQAGVIFYTDALAADGSKPDPDNIRIIIMAKVIRVTGTEQGAANRMMGLRLPARN
jgi:hypothetical protein